LNVSSYKAKLLYLLIYNLLALNLFILDALQEKYNTILKEEKKKSNNDEIYNKVFDSGIKAEFDYDYSKNLTRIKRVDNSYQKNVKDKMEVKTCNIYIYKKHHINIAKSNGKQNKRAESKNTKKSKYKSKSADKQIKKEKNLENNYKIEIRNNTLGLYKETKKIIPYNKLDKIDIISYKLTDKEIDSIKSSVNFNYI